MEAAGWRTRVEKQLVCSARVSIACAKGKSPQTRNADHIIILIPQFSLKMTRNSVKREDLTAPELANQNAMTETAEITWRLNQTPRSIIQGTVFQAVQHFTFWGKDIHRAQAWAKGHKILRLVLLGKSYVEVTPDVLHIEGNKVLRQVVIHKREVCSRRRLEVCVENSDFAFVHISHIEAAPVFALGDRRARQS